MEDYKVVDKKVNSENSNQQQKQSNSSNTQPKVEDNVQAKQGTVATEQQLPQTGINNYVPQMLFGGSLMLLLLAIAFKLGTLVNRGEA